MDSPLRDGLFEAPRVGVLLIHGMSDSPYSMRSLGERLHSEGAWVLEIAPRSIGGLCSRSLRFVDPEGGFRSLEELILRHALRMPIVSMERERDAAGVMMIPVPRLGMLRAKRLGLRKLFPSGMPSNWQRKLPSGNSREILISTTTIQNIPSFPKNPIH